MDIDVITIWNALYGGATEAFDYSGRLMKLSSDTDALDYPSISFIRPLDMGGQVVEGNIVLCAAITNLEKNETFPTWKANGKTFQAHRIKGTSNSYEIKDFL